MNDHHSLVLSLCRGVEPPARIARQLDGLADEAARRRFFESMGSHGVLGLVLSRLVRLVGDERPWSSDIRARFERVRVRASILQLKCERIVRILEQARIGFVVLKGAGVARAYYDDAVERDLRDLDLLVAPDDIATAVACLEDHGYTVPSNTTIDVYRNRHFHVPLRHRDSHCVELHWALTMPSSPFFVDARDIFDRAVSIGFGESSTFRIPGPEHLLLHCVIQNLQEDFSRLARTVDADRIVTRAVELDWASMASEAMRGNLRRPTALTLQLAASLLGTSIPRSELANFLPGPVVRFNIGLLRPEHHLLQPESERKIVWGDLLLIWLMDRGIHRVRALLSPPPSHAFSPTGRSPGLLFRVSRTAKILLYQVWLGLRSLTALTSSSGRAQIRFWSSQASNSDRL